MEQVRMAPLSPLPYILGKTLPYLVISFVSALLVILSAMLLFDLPMRGSWLLLCAVDRAVPGRRAGAGAADLDDRGDAAGGVPGGAAVVAAADDDPVGVHLSDLEHADGGAGITHIVPARYFLVALRAIVLKGADITAFWQDWWRWRSSPPWRSAWRRCACGGSGA